MGITASILLQLSHSGGEDLPAPNASVWCLGSRFNLATGENVALSCFCTILKLVYISMYSSEIRGSRKALGETGLSGQDIILKTGERKFQVCFRRCINQLTRYLLWYVTSA